MSKSENRRSKGLALLVFAFASSGIGPCGPIPGGAVSGDEVHRPVDDWSFVDPIPRCAVEVRPDSPHSVTVNCMSWQGDLFVSCSDCAGKRWSSYALANPVGRIQIGEDVYPVTLERVEDPTHLDAVWKARAAKVGDDQGTPRPDGWWTFQLRSR